MFWWCGVAYWPVIENVRGWVHRRKGLSRGHYSKFQVPVDAQNQQVTPLPPLTSMRPDGRSVQPPDLVLLLFSTHPTPAESIWQLLISLLLPMVYSATWFHLYLNERAKGGFCYINCKHIVILGVILRMNNKCLLNGKKLYWTIFFQN